MTAARITGTTSDFLPDLRLGFENLRAHKLRSLLTMLGMIFGVAAVVAMLSIGAGAQQEVMAFIEQLGVRNLIVEAREAPDWQSHQKMRKISAGLTFQDEADAANRAVVVELIDQKKHQGVAMVAIVHDDEIRHLIADRIVDVTSFAAAA